LQSINWHLGTTVDASQSAGSKTNANPTSIVWARGDNMVEARQFVVSQSPHGTPPKVAMAWTHKQWNAFGKL